MLHLQPAVISLVSQRWRSSSHMLQLRSHGIIPSGNLPIRCRKEKTANEGKEEDKGENCVCFECEDPSCEQPEAPNEEVESHGSVVSLCGSACCCVPSWRIGCCNCPRGCLEDAEGEPEDCKHAHYHHREKVAHYPFSDHCR